MIYKAELIVDGATTDITDDIKNWDDITVSLKRNDYGGVVRTYSDKFEFVRRAYEIIRKEYRDKFMNPSATLVLYTQNNDFSFAERFRCTLDFASLVDDGFVISMNALDNSLEALIKANKSQTYDIPVSEIKEDKQLNYDRLNIKYQTSFIGIPDDYDSDVVDTYELSLGVTYSSYMGDYAHSFIFPINYIDSDDSGGSFLFHNALKKQVSGVMPSGGTISLSDNMYFMECLSYVRDLHINFKFAFGFQKEKIGSPQITGTFTPRQPWALVLFKGIKEQNGNYYLSKLKSFESNYDNTNVVIDWDVISNFNEGDILTAMIFVPVFKYDEDDKVRVEFNASCYVSTSMFKTTQIGNVFYISRGNKERINVINPITLLSRLLYEITQQNINCAIDYNQENVLLKSKIIAAESIRGFEKAKIHTSFSKFVEWMEAVFGYVYRISDNKIEFMHRDKLYHNFVTKSINNNSINNYSFSMDGGLLFSGIKIGYDKQDYDSINGKDEFRFTNNYSTGITLSDKILELISPYRADAYGMEFLTFKRGKKTTDDSSDNDVFFVCCDEYDSEYVVTRDGWSIEGVLDPSTMFNVMYSPRSMVEANKSYIGACTNSIKFTASEGNADITINGIPEKETVEVSDEERLFMPYKVEVDTSDIELPADHDALISITHEDEEYQGYISDIDTRFTKEEACKYSLMVKRIV